VNESGYFFYFFRSRYKAATAEVSDSGGPGIVIGVALVGNNDADLRSRGQKIIHDMQNWADVELINDELDVLHYEDIEMERDFEKYNP
jgi:hypothetical protein